jgi:uncharacterized protein (DUF2147 family)
MKRILGIDSLEFRRLGRVLIAGLALALFSTAQARAADANDPHGLWLRPEGGVQFSFYDCDGLLCAKVVAAKNAEDQSSIGTVILRGAKQTGPNEWKGKLYNAEDGNTYDGFITIKKPGELTLKGCLWGVLCSGETWKRVSAASDAQTSRMTAGLFQ